ncbi:C3HC zinc finger-like-domain-containing protein [Gilbertella persicaria]|uniref:C3HC zinc finger-like-domain-containing protein n=1 Tax=Gilbertella persicaria TaxID=101096 RepID=UPI00221FC87F|nr:C3HC zinc finger-like-domain-containing protein [Gilbertella persicaria]KAI8082632.1 C3HC zinc finger-like-domain-containing protein [Gilbertella persicaria]
MQESITTEPNLKQETIELRALTLRIRKEAKLLPLFKAKRPASTDDAQDTPTKLLKINHTDVKAPFNDREALMTRLKSYSTLYHCASRPISALDCAKHGWRDTQTVDGDPTTSVLECIDCKRKMYVIEIEDRYKNKPEAIAVIDKYKKGLFECHQEDCQWRHSHCEDSVYSFPSTTISEGIEKFKNEARMLLSTCTAKQETLPALKHSLDKAALNKIKYLVQHFESNQDNVTINPYILSAVGWSTLHPEIPGVKCDLCFSQKGFYQVHEFDVLQEHKAYCPWRTSGLDWMMEIICIEYNLLVKRQDLSLSSNHEQDEKLYKIKQKIYESQNVLKTWKSKIEAISRVSEL